MIFQNVGDSSLAEFMIEMNFFSKQRAVKTDKTMRV
ncbi:hypothetical protein ND2E_2718 [Colwellia psychrerythraea]|uniref:Uncharacterized protein n=1 Tax=Colwellia psychrerythraea TaxID=28229 RepID=A0A099KTR2_COLPS|nr:hypothetical protein ND2E_2718 [Colwellia psychrerythraea]